jgi:histone H3/H4
VDIIPCRSGLNGAAQPTEPGDYGKPYKEGQKKTARMADLIVKAAVKEELDDKNVASDFYEALDEEVTDLLEDAARRAEANGRKTVQPRDL